MAFTSGYCERVYGLTTGTASRRVYGLTVTSPGMLHAWVGQIVTIFAFPRLPARVFRDRPTPAARYKRRKRGKRKFGGLSSVVVIAGFSLGSARVFSGFLPGTLSIFLGLWDLICAF